MALLKTIIKPKGRLFAIGDIHGCSDETETLLNWLERNEGLSQDDLVIFIGDYIDRGFNSRAVIDLLCDFRRKYPASIFLKGNHEDMLLHFLGKKGSNGDVYIKNGGGPTLASYGLTEDASPEDLMSRIPKNHLDFFDKLESFIECDNYYFVHAGLNPKRTLKRQVVDDLYWIREGFMEENHPFGKTVVFGHTPHADVIFELPYKIGIDTGLVYGNKLTSIELTQRLVYQVSCQGQEVIVSDFPEQ